MKKIPHVSKRTVWADVTAEMEDLRRETEVQRSDLMALENARLDQYAGIGLIAGGVLLATLWADTPVAESLTGSKALGHVHTVSRRRVSRRPHTTQRLHNGMSRTSSAGSSSSVSSQEEFNQVSISS